MIEEEGAPLGAGVFEQRLSGRCCSGAPLRSATHVGPRECGFDFLQSLDRKSVV